MQRKDNKIKQNAYNIILAQSPSIGLSFCGGLEATELFLVSRSPSSALNPLKVLSLDVHGQGDDMDSPD